MLAWSRLVALYLSIRLSLNLFKTGSHVLFGEKLLAARVGTFFKALSATCFDGEGDRGREEGKHRTATKKRASKRM